VSTSNNLTPNDPSRGTDEHLTWVVPNIFQRPSGRLVAMVNQNGRRMEQGFPPETPLEVVERWVHEMKAGRRPRPVKELRWVGLRKVVDNIFKRPSGRWVAKVYQNGRPMQQGFPPETPLEVVERWVQEMKDGRQPRPTVKENRWHRMKKVAPNIFRLPRGRWWVQVSQNGRRIQQSFAPETPREDVVRFVQEVKAGRRPRLAKGTRHHRLTSVAPNISQTLSGGWYVRINQNGRRIIESFPPGTPREVVERFVQEVKAGRRPRPVKESRWYQTTVAQHIHKRPSGWWLTEVRQNGRRIKKGFPPETPREVVERHVQQVIDGRQPRPLKEIQFELLTRVTDNIFQRPSGGWFTNVQQNGRRIKKGFPPETPREVVERHVQQVIDGRHPRPLKENLVAAPETPLRQWRKKLGLTLEDLAKLGDVKVAAAWAHDNGKRLPSLTVQRNYAKGLSNLTSQTITPDDLFGRLRFDRRHRLAIDEMIKK
jgi:DNA-binding XRE family transcriptional regulator